MTEEIDTQLLFSLPSTDGGKNDLPSEHNPPNDGNFISSSDSIVKNVNFDNHNHIDMRAQSTKMGENNFWALWAEKETEIDSEMKFICSQCSILISWENGYALERCHHIFCLHCLRVCTHHQLESILENSNECNDSVNTNSNTNQNTNVVENVNENETRKVNGQHYLEVKCPICNIAFTKRDLRNGVTNRSHRITLSLSSSFHHSDGHLFSRSLHTSQRTESLGVLSESLEKLITLCDGLCLIVFLNLFLSSFYSNSF
jgi:hypothetical protein